MTIKDTENNYLTIEITLKDWLNNIFDAVFKSNYGMCELIIEGELRIWEIANIYKMFRKSVFKLMDNDSERFEKDCFGWDSNNEYDIEMIVSNGNRISDIRNLKFSYKYDMYEVGRTEVSAKMSDLFVSKKDLVQAAYDLECEMHNEIENYWKAKLLKA